MNEPAEDVSPSNSRVGAPSAEAAGTRRSKVNAPVRPGPVVVLGVRLQDTLQVTPAEHEDVVEALSSYGADRTLRERVRPRCLNGCLHDAEALGPEDFVERSRELGVSIPEQDVLVPSSCVIARFRAC